MSSHLINLLLVRHNWYRILMNCKLYSVYWNTDTKVSILLKKIKYSGPVGFLWTFKILFWTRWRHEDGNDGGSPRRRSGLVNPGHLRVGGIPDVCPGGGTVHPRSLSTTDHLRVYHCLWKHGPCLQSPQNSQQGRLTSSGQGVKRWTSFDIFNLFQGQMFCPRCKSNIEN